MNNVICMLSVIVLWQRLGDGDEVAYTEAKAHLDLDSSAVIAALQKEGSSMEDP